MLIRRNKHSHRYLYLSVLLLSIIILPVVGGVKSLINYKHIVQPDLVINFSSIRNFTSEYIERTYQKIMAKELPDKNGITSFWLYADKKNLHLLNIDLPESGKEKYVSGYLNIDNLNFTSKIDFRYRGGLPLHWLHEKKSFRIKLPPFSTYHDEQKFDLVNIATPSVITDLLSYKMAKEIGLLAPEYFPARLFVNNKYNGLHFFLSAVDESLLRRNRRMPGSIYSGDTLIRPNPFGNLKGYREVSYTAYNTPLLWTDQRLWKKSSSRNAEFKKDRSDITTYIDIINLTKPVKFMLEFEKYFDKKKFYSFWALDTLTGTYHHDMIHNHKLYFDPYKGKFEPIAWDLRFWDASILRKDSVEYPLLKQIKLNPILEYERDLVTYNVIRKFSSEKVINDINHQCSPFNSASELIGS